jgi:glycosyltransferase involved in cell wall biosynthesis
MKVVFIAYRHPIDDGRVFHKEIKSLIDNFKIDIHYLTENVVYGNIIKLFGRGQIFKHQGIEVFNIVSKTGINPILKRIYDLRLSLKYLCEINPDVIHCHEPDRALLSGLLFKIFYNKNVILIHDLHEFPGAEDYDNFIKSNKKWLGNIFFYFWRIWINFTINYVDYFICANSIIKGYILSLNHKSKVSVVSNNPLINKNIISTSYTAGEKLILCHEGTLGFDRGLFHLLNAMCNLKDFAILKIIGSIYDSDLEYVNNFIKQNKLENSIIFTGWVKYENINLELLGSHIGLILFDYSKNNLLAGPPNKLFNYMNNGISVLSTNLPETSFYIEKYSCGLIFDNITSENLSSTIKSIYNGEIDINQFSKNGLNAIRDYESWDHEKKKLLKIYNKISNKCVV